MRRLAIILAMGVLLNLFGCTGQAKKTADPTNEEPLKSVDDVQNGLVHKTLTPEILSKVKDDKLEQVILYNIAARIADDGDELGIVKSLTPGQRAIYVTMIVEGEVDNGGFNQFYYNPSGQFAGMMEDAFKIIEAHQYADLARQANTIYAGIKEDLEKYRNGTTESFSESYDNNPLNDLDDKFYSLDEDGTLSKLRVKYIRSNIKEFVTD